MLTGAKGSLKEGGAQDLEAAFGHFDFAFELAVFFEPGIIAHESLEASRGPVAADHEPPTIQLSYELNPSIRSDAPPARGSLSCFR